MPAQAKGMAQILGYEQRMVVAWATSFPFPFLPPSLIRYKYLCGDVTWDTKDAWDAWDAGDAGDAGDADDAWCKCGSIMIINNTTYVPPYLLLCSTEMSFFYLLFFFSFLLSSFFSSFHFKSFLRTSGPPSPMPTSLPTHQYLHIVISVTRCVPLPPSHSYHSPLTFFHVSCDIRPTRGEDHLKSDRIHLHTLFSHPPFNKAFSTNQAATSSKVLLTSFLFLSFFTCSHCPPSSPPYYSAVSVLSTLRSLHIELKSIHSFQVWT